MAAPSHNPFDRQVRRLQLSAPNRDENSRALRILEESLRLMELPGESAGRVYYFRRLKFPRLRHGETPTSYAGRLEHFCRERAAAAVHFLDPSADAHDAVFARTPAEPWAAVLRFLVQRRSLDSWVWSAAVAPAARAVQPSAMADLLVDLGRRQGPEGVIEVLTSVESIVLRAVLERLERRHVESGMLGGVSRPAVPRTAAIAEESRNSLTGLSAERRRIATEFIARWPRRDVRVVWLASVLLVESEPARVLDSRLAELATAVADGIFERAVEEQTARTIAAIPATSVPDQRTIRHAALTLEPALAESQPESSDIADEARDVGIPSSCAGIFFLLGELNRMGVGAAISASPGLIGAGFLHALLMRLIRIAKAETDPAGHALLSLLSKEALRTQPTPEADRLARTWIVALRRRIWRAARMTPASVAARPGFFFLTRTHLEIVLPQNSLDLRVRKTGMDIDPGWLPWLGRIVSFRYLCEVREIVPPRARPHHGARR